jgi:uncharacterized membrane protein YgcG
MPEAVEAGMTIDSRNQFNTSLEQLTQAVSKQNPTESLSAALTVYKSYADMAQLFSNSVPAEIYKVKYEVMAAVFEASQKNWSAAEAHVPKMKEYWVYVSAQAKQTDTKAVSRTEFAVMDLEKAIQSKQIETIIIKGEIAMTNLKNLETTLASQTSSGSSGQSQGSSGQSGSSGSSQGGSSSQGQGGSSGQGQSSR